MLTSRLYVIWTCVIVLSGMVVSTDVLQAQTTSWTVPNSGYVHDSVTRSVRPVSGFVGSAVLGPAVLSDIDWVSLAPNQKSAIVQHNGSLVWIADLAAPAREQLLDGIPLPRQAFWAADASRAVLLTEDAKLIWLSNTNLSSGTAPSQESHWRMQDLAPSASRGSIARWSILAVDSTADRVLLATSAATGSQLWLASRAIPPVSLAFTGHPVAAVFAAGSATAFVAETSTHLIFKLSQLDSSPVSETLLTPQLHVDRPAGLVLSASDDLLFIADRNSTTIQVINASSGLLVNELPADFMPLSLTALGSNRFMLNPAELSVQPLLILETTQPAKVSFVPRGY